MPKTVKSSNSDAVTVLAELAAAIAACRICRDSPIRTPLPHEPRPVVRPSASARLLVAGQAPGVRVHDTGLPFNDPSGDRLRQWMQMDRETFYDASRVAIVPMGFCFPGHDRHKGDLPPRPECRLTWHDRLFAHMGQIEVILAIGSYAHAYHLPRLGYDFRRATPMSKTVANWRAYVSGSPKVFVLPHPSWRN
ncbi:MAG: uracil-DNA glycosylase family protein, partial [Hyphomicrobiales bacterium]|nr:uracil-DNA glycosylase family protein [Hyphomicrobiales bacterium]